MTRRTLSNADKQRIYNEVVVELKKQPDHKFNGSVKDVLERIQARKGTNKPFNHMDMMKLRVRHLKEQGAISLHRQNGSEFGKVLSICLVDESKAIVMARGSNRSSSQPESQSTTSNVDTSQSNPASKAAQRRSRVLGVIVQLLHEHKEAGELLVIPNALAIDKRLERDEDRVASSTLRGDLYFLRDMGLIRIKQSENAARRYRRVSLGKDQTLESFSGLLADDVVLDKSALEEKKVETPEPPQEPAQETPVPASIDESVSEDDEVDMAGMIEDLGKSLDQLREAREELQQTLDLPEQSHEELATQNRQLAQERDSDDTKLKILRDLPKSMHTAKWTETCDRLGKKITTASDELNDITQRLNQAKQSQSDKRAELEQEISDIDLDITSTEAAIELLTKDQ